MWLHEDEAANKKMHNLYSLPNIIKITIKITKSGSMGRAENVTCVEETTNPYRILVGNPARKSHLEELIVIGRRCKLQAVLDCVARKFVL
jgi:hypothetical protein